MEFTNKNTGDQAKHMIDSQKCLKERKKSTPPIIMDLRASNEYQDDHLIGAYSFPADILKDQMSKIPQYAQVILYGDADDNKTTESVEIMLEGSFENVSFVQGGFKKLLSTLKESKDEIILTDFPESHWQEKIEGVLSDKVRPALANDGGGLQIVKIEQSKVYIHYEGACSGCDSAATGTLNFIRNTLSTSLNHEVDVIMA